MTNTTRHSQSDDSYDVIIVGAGPVGLLLGCLLGMQNLRILVLEKRKQPLQHSMAIGITPPSLHILSKLGLTDEFIRRGVKVRDCHLHGQSGHLGRVSFREIEDEHRFVLSLPQSETIAILQEKLATLPSVTLLSGMELLDARQSADSAEAVFRSPNGTETSTVRAHHLVACDGGRSRVRELMGVRSTGHGYPCHFVMGDFLDRSGLKDDAHLFFTAAGSVESFPLPGQQRRWIIQTHEHLDSPPAGLISDVVRQRVSIELESEDQINQSSFTPRRLNCDRYHVGRLILCGDAAHVMSPIGGQGMNTGFADAEFLAGALCAVLIEGQSAPRLLAAYDHYRRKAAQAAITRAHWGMWLGTWRGRPLSTLRDFILRRACSGMLARHMGPFYAMLTIPYNTLKRVPLTDPFKLEPKPSL